MVKEICTGWLKTEWLGFIFKKTINVINTKKAAPSFFLLHVIFHNSVIRPPSLSPHLTSSFPATSYSSVPPTTVFLDPSLPMPEANLAFCLLICLFFSWLWCLDIVWFPQNEAEIAHPKGEEEER